MCILFRSFMTYLLPVALVFFSNSSLLAQDKNKSKSTYSYDPYYEESPRTPSKSRTQPKTSSSPYTKNSNTVSEETFGFEAYEKISTSYTWRTVTRNDEPISETFLKFSVLNFSFSLTAIMDLTDYGIQAGYGDQSFEFTELDLALAYENTFNDFIYKIEVKHYLFPNKYTPILSKGRMTNDSTTEINARIEYDVFLSPSLLISYDVDEVSDFYLELSSHYSFKTDLWNMSNSINISGSLGFGSSGFNDYYFGVDKFTTTGLTLIANWEWFLDENMILTPEIGVSIPLDSEISDNLEKASKIQSDPVMFYFSLKFAIKF